SESLLDKARRLQQVAGEVKAVKAAIQHASRLQARADDLRAALNDPTRATETWLECRQAGVADLPKPADMRLADAVAELARRLKPADPPPDADFDAVKHGLRTMARRTTDAITQAWPAFARSKAAAGLASVRVLPPVARRSLGETITAVEQAITRPPDSPAQVRLFLRHVATLDREAGAAHVQDLPAPLLPVLEQLGDEGFPLSKLTDEQLRKIGRAS